MRSPLTTRAWTSFQILYGLSSASGRNVLLNFAVDDGRCPDAATAAHRLQAVAKVAALELVQQAVHQDGARRTERMADGDGPTVDVGLRQVGAGLLLPREHDRREGFVDLEEVDILELQAGSLEHRCGAGDRSLEHEHRVRAHHRLRADPSTRLEAE